MKTLWKDQTANTIAETTVGVGLSFLKTPSARALYPSPREATARVPLEAYTRKEKSRKPAASWAKLLLLFWMDKYWMTCPINTTLSASKVIKQKGNFWNRKPYLSRTRKSKLVLCTAEIQIIWKSPYILLLRQI